jgi:hypothetical protein
MPHHHHRNVARSANELVVRGNYFEISIIEILLDATVKPLSYDDELKRLILFETIYADQWDYRLKTNFPEPILIDGEGFQHSAYSLCSDAVIYKSKHMKAGTSILPVADEIEGHAKGRGWVAFPFLEKSVVPHRVVFQTNVFDPGYTCGSVRDSETLELVFDLSLFGKLLSNGAKK